VLRMEMAVRVMPSSGIAVTGADRYHSASMLIEPVYDGR